MLLSFVKGVRHRARGIAFPSSVVLRGSRVGLTRIPLGGSCVLETGRVTGRVAGRVTGRMGHQWILTRRVDLRRCKPLSSLFCFFCSSELFLGFRDTFTPRVDAIDSANLFAIREAVSSE